MRSPIAPGHDGFCRADVPGQQACWTRTAISRPLRCWRASNEAHREGELHQGQGKRVDRMCQHRVDPCLIWSGDSEYIRDPRPATWYEHKQLLSNSNRRCGQMDRPGFSGDRKPKSSAGPQRARLPEIARRRFWLTLSEVVGNAPSFCGMRNLNMHELGSGWI